MEIKDEKQLYKLVKDFWGYKVQMICRNSEKKEIKAILYDAFLFDCGFDDQHGQFGAGIVIDENQPLITRFLGQTCSLNNDEESIKESLKMVDDYCRLRLPDKYLEAYYEAYGKENYDDYDL